MHVYLRDEQVRLRMEEVDAEGLTPAGSDLRPVAFFADENENPSFRALLPPDTLDALRDAISAPVTLGVLAEEPENVEDEIRAMVGLAVPIPGGQEEETEDEPWRASAGSSEAWRGEDAEDSSEDAARTALLAFAPLVRFKRRYPTDFGEELADLLESALSGATRPVLQARVDRMLDEI